jgi:hypothetical protein
MSTIHIRMATRTGRATCPCGWVANVDTRTIEETRRNLRLYSQAHNGNRHEGKYAIVLDYKGETS